MSITTPDAVPGLLCWLEPSLGGMFQTTAGSTPTAADGDPIGYVPDQSGNGANANGSAAMTSFTGQGLLQGNRLIYKTSSMGGLPGIRFQGNQYLQFGTNSLWDKLAASGYTATFVFAPSQVSGPYYALFSNSGYLASFFSLVISNGQFARYPGVAANFANGALSAGSNYILTYSVSPFCVDTTGQIFVEENLYVNGLLAGRRTAQRDFVATTTSWTIGATPQPSFPAYGDMSLFTLYQGVLSLQQRIAVENYAATKYAVPHKKPPTLLPSNDVMVQCTGNSLTIGIWSTLSGDYVSQVALRQTNVPPQAFFNWGLSGQTTASMISAAPSREDALIVPGIPSFLIYWEGTNEISSTTDNAATAIANTISYLTGRRAAGHKGIALLTVIARNNYFNSGQTASGFESARQTYNTWARNNWAAYADVLVDVGSSTTCTVNGQTFNVSKIGAPSAYSDTTIFANDTIHLLNAGYALVAAPVSAAVDYLFQKSVINKTVGGYAAGQDPATLIRPTIRPGGTL